MTNLQSHSLSARNEIKKFLETHSSPGDHLLIGVSGGFDSMALGHLVLSLREELGIRLSTLTVDHSLQENSPNWTEQTVLRLQELGIQDAYSAKVDVDLNSENGLEAAARSADAHRQELAQRMVPGGQQPGDPDPRRLRLHA